MSAAIFYYPEGFDTSGPKLMGRQAAGEGFLRGWFRYASDPEKYCFAASPQAFEVFKTRAAALGGDPTQCRFIPFQNPRGLAKPGTLYLPDPNLGHFAWRRRWLDPKAYSLCGVTHTLASERVMDQIGALLTAPVEPWDALVCTSNAGKNAVLRVLSEWRDYQTARFRGTPPPLPQLPVIPLGVDAETFAPGPDWERERTTWREKLGIGPDDVAALFVGRLSFHAKAHPLPAYLALEAAAERTGKRIHFIQAGRFSNELIEEQFVWGAKTFAPSVTAHFLSDEGEASPSGRPWGIWAAGDFFLSLSDNVQETFGLTPIEAMAAGLPVVVSDWDGYRENVRHGVDGFTIPTLAPPPGAGEGLAFHHFAGFDDYDRYIGQASQSTAVDIQRAAEACARLAEDAELRRTLGAAGRRRAREVYDWSVAIGQYEELWAHLAERREHGAPAVPRRPATFAHPLRQDPFALFLSFSTGTFRPDTQVQIAREDWRAHLELLRTAAFANFADKVLMPVEWRFSLLSQMAAGEGVLVGEILAVTPAAHKQAALRTLGWLYKTGLVQLGEFPS